MADEIMVVEVARPGATGGNVSTNDWNTIRADVDANLAAIAALDTHALSDVSATSPTNGQVLIFNSGSGLYVPGNPPIGVIYGYNSGSSVSTDLQGVDAGTGLSATEGTQDGGHKLVIAVTYAGTGAANSAARSDHSHSAMLTTIDNIAATGTISSGTRTLDTINIALDNGVTYDLEAEGFIIIRNNVSNGVVELRVQVNGGTVQTMSAANVGGVPSGFKINQVFANVAGTGANVSAVFSLAYVSGDASDIRNGQFIFRARPRR